MVKVGIVGAAGYGGGELLRYLSGHPEARVVAATSKHGAGEQVGRLFPNLAHLDLVLQEEDLSHLEDCDIVFLAGTDETGMCMAGPILESGAKVIDLSAAFRFESAEDYARWYGHPHRSPELLSKAVFGLPELHRDKIKGASFIGNPGCYVTASLLALAPLAKDGAIDAKSIIIDGISGVSGAGRSKADVPYRFAEMNENAWAYKIAGTHRHTGEIEKELTKLSGEETTITFTPHIVPMSRGVLATCHALLKGSTSEEEIREIYQTFYKTEPFVLFGNELPETKATAGSNRCHIGLSLDERTNRITVVSALDNLGKGMAGQAVQNMNLMFGLEETAGLTGGSLWP